MKQDFRFQNIETLIVKVTHRCNMSCSYCYEDIINGSDMDLHVFYHLVDKAFENTTSPSINFILHGGEPTLMKNEWFNLAVEYAEKKALSCNKRCDFSLQTNLLNVSEAKLNLFKYLNIKLGVSLDGPSKIGKTMRGREDKVLENYFLARELGLKVGVLMTINQSNYSQFDLILDWLENDLKINHFKANIIYPVGKGINLDSLYPEQIFEANHQIYNYLINTKGEKVIEENSTLELFRFFSETEGNQRDTICHEKVCGAGKKVLGVTPKGDILPCGRFQWNDDTYFLGTLFEDYDTGKNYSDRVSDFHSLVPENWYDCQNCQAKKICSFGCQAFIVRSKARANIDCLPTKMRFAFIQANKDKLYPVYQTLKDRLGMTSPTPENYTDIYTPPYKDSTTTDDDDKPTARFRNLSKEHILTGYFDSYSDSYSDRAWYHE